MIFDFAGFRFELRLPDGALRRDVGIAWKSFTTQAAPQTTIDVEFTTDESYRPSEWVMPLAQATPEGGLRLEGSGVQADISADRRRAHLVQWEERFPLSSVVKTLLADFCLQREGLLLHCVGVAHLGRAGIFVGQSGAGKSTLGALASEAGLQRLSDELVAIIPSENGFVAHATPWNIGAPGQAKVALLGVLSHAAEPHVEAVGGGELARMILTNSVMADPSPVGRAKMFQIASHLVERTKPVKLAFAKNPNVGDVLRHALADACSGLVA